MATKAHRARRQAAQRQRQAITWGLALGAGLVLVVWFAFFALNFKRAPDTRYQAGKPGKGEVAPEFSLPMVGGGMFSLANYRGQKNLLLFFQEGVGCDVCWRQAVDLQTQRDFYSELDVEVATIAIDSSPVLEPVVTEYGLTLPVLSDSDKSVSTVYDMLGFGMHPGFRPAHSFVLIGKDGVILWRADYGAPPRNAMYVPEREIRDAVARALQ